MAEERSLHFIEEIIESDLQSGKHSAVRTRFPPEPNGYLHIGHATSIWLNFGVARKYGGKTNLRFDDTNPTTEETEYVEAIKRDVQWLGYQWAEELYASDYFEKLYGFALQLIDQGLAYVDDSSSEEIAAQKGDLSHPGSDSACRSRTVEENRQLFEKMRAGKYPDGAKVLRAKIDMAHPNLLMRDPLLYRIRHAAHHRTGHDWCIYPMYDFAHGQSDSIEQITHSLCTLEFVPHRELYDWLIEKLGIFPSRQIEFARRNLTYTVMSKRKLLQLVQEGHVSGWDDPRMPTISGMRRRGYTPEALRDFCERIGVAKRENLVDVGLLEFCVREHLNRIAYRRMVVFKPLKLVITNWEGEKEDLEAENNPEATEDGLRTLKFGREVWIDQEDFMETPPKKFFRLAPGAMVRLKHAYIVQCNEVVRDAAGGIVELHCTYLPDSRSGQDTSGVNVKGTLHWVEASTAIPVEIHQYDRLFNVENPGAEEGDFKSYINPQSLTVVQGALAEPQLAEANEGEKFQFLRKGYYTRDGGTEALAFIQTVGLKDSWAKGTSKP